MDGWIKWKTIPQRLKVGAVEWESAVWKPYQWIMEDGGLVEEDQITSVEDWPVPNRLSQGT